MARTQAMATHHHRLETEYHVALKHKVAKIRCLWHGHEPTLGIYYSPTYGRYMDCVCCKHCLKVL